jgi:hypothetical protein
MLGGNLKAILEMQTALKYAQKVKRIREVFLKLSNSSGQMKCGCMALRQVD